MNGEDRNMILRAHSQQFAAYRRSRSEIEWALPFFGGEPQSFAFALMLRYCSKIQMLQGQVRMRSDRLNGFTFDRDKGRAQNLMSSNDLVDAFFQHRRVEGSA